jgi:Spy/CpxP family protein refolding chaperone
MKTAVIILIVLGVVVISGIAYARYQGFCNGPEGRAEWLVKRISNKLELDESQKRQLEQLRDQALELRGEMRSERPRHMEQLLGLLDAPSFDRQAANRLLADKQAWLATVGPQLIDGFADFNDSLRDDQRSKLREMIARHRQHRHGHCCSDHRPAMQE